MRRLSPSVGGTARPFGLLEGSEVRWCARPLEPASRYALCLKPTRGSSNHSGAIKVWSFAPYPADFGPAEGRRAPSDVCVTDTAAQGKLIATHRATGQKLPTYVVAPRILVRSVTTGGRTPALSLNGGESLT